MAVIATCDHCDSQYTVPDYQVGKRLRCPRCRSVIELAPIELTEAQMLPDDPADGAQDAANDIESSLPHLTEDDLVPGRPPIARLPAPQLAACSRCGGMFVASLLLVVRDQTVCRDCAREGGPRPALSAPQSRKGKKKYPSRGTSPSGLNAKVIFAMIACIGWMGVMRSAPKGPVEAVFVYGVALAGTIGALVAMLRHPTDTE